MMSWVSFLFEAGLATLMVILIIYCIKLNRRLSLLRSQNADIADMIAGLREASERAEQSVQHLKAAGLSAERSLRSAIEDAAVAQVDLSQLVATSSQITAPQMPQSQPYNTVAAQSLSAAADVPKGLLREVDAYEGARREKIKRDMLIGEPPSSTNRQESATPPPARPKTREEAEETVLQAIRSARVGT